MKRIKNSIIVKCVLLLFSFSFGIGFAYQGYHIIRYSYQYSPSQTTLESTAEFGSLYLKYLERVCVYVKYREAGFLDDPTSIYSSSDLVSILNGEAAGNLKPENSVYEFTQDSYEYYNRLVNIDCENFFYYVKNLDTGEYYYSPHFQQLFNTKDTLSSNTLEEYLTNISKKPSYLILQTKNSKFFTNIESSSFVYANQSSISWCTDFLNIDTSKEVTHQKKVSDDSQEKIKTIESSPEVDSKSVTEFGSDFSFLVPTDAEREDVTYLPSKAQNTKNYAVYTFYDPSFSQLGGEFTALTQNFKNLRTDFNHAMYLCPIFFVLCILFSLLFLGCAGHKKDVEGTALNAFDRLYTEIPILLIGVGLLLSIPLLRTVRDICERNRISNDLAISLIVFSYVYMLLAIGITTMTKRLKAQTLFSHSLLGKFTKYMINTVCELNDAMVTNLHAGIRLVLIIIGYSILQFLVFLFFYEDRIVYLFLSILVVLLMCFALMKTYLDLNKVIKGTKAIVNGDLDYHIPAETLSQPVKGLAKDINNIRDGLSRAVGEQIKSERLKTELITNVSHDIKTPLTSIINYVDLLNKLNLPDENAQNYLKILTEKSWRLKTLIEDLVEASKASAGAITMNLERINIIELLKQSVGEYEDRLMEHQLEPVLDVEQENLYIMADGRSTFRIIENLLSNAAKYALPGTRVYIYAGSAGSNATIIMKNISATKLGVKSDELIERFVRGDISRNTEGSGLGLSIANSLAALQHGKFELFVDGDLFKAIVTLPLAK